MTRDNLLTELRRLARSNGPIIVGPWMSEVGFELLYWIPFLRWAVTVANLDRRRLHILSRGGCRSWYADISSNYLELYDHYTPDALRRLNQQRIREQAIHGNQVGLKRGQVTAKQYYFSQTESRIVNKAVAADTMQVLHPSMMYRAFRPMWRSHTSHLYTQWAQIARAKRIEAPELVSPHALPDRYVAVKFYASEACPAHDGHCTIAQHIVRVLTEHIDVVLLHTGTAYDEHGEFQLPEHPRVHRVALAPTTNLEAQTAIIARSVGYVGTYGGFAYLAPLLGVPTLACYGRRNFRNDHYTLMTDLARRMRVPFKLIHLLDGPSNVRRQRADWMRDAA